MSTSRPIVLVAAKRSQYQKHVRERHDPRVMELLARHDPVVAFWRRTDDSHRRTLDAVLENLDTLGARAVVLAKPHAPFDPSKAQLVVTVGGDGTLLAVSHHVSTQPVLGVNSAPGHSIGYFCGTELRGLKGALEQALSNSLPKTRLMRMRVEVNGRLRSARVLNEALFCHTIPAAVSRFILTAEEHTAEYRSSGFWVGPSAGSTGAIRSAGGQVLPLGSRKLQVVVREPYSHGKARWAPLRLLIPDGKDLVVRSKMDAGAMYLDGPFKRLRVELGDVVRFCASEEPLTVLGIRHVRQ